MCLVPLEAHLRGLAGGAMRAGVRHLPRPGLQMRLKRCEALEPASGDGVRLHIADAALVLALRAGAIRRAGLHPEAPVPGKGVQLRVHDHFARHGVVVLDQRAGVVEQHLFRDTAEGPEGTLHPGKPVLLPLGPEGPHMQPTRMAEGRDEEEHLLLFVADPDPALAEVDLQLLAGPRLEAHRRPRFGPQRLSQMRHRPLHRAQAHHDILLRGELLAHDIGVARHTAGTARQPSPQCHPAICDALPAPASPTPHSASASRSCPTPPSAEDLPPSLHSWNLPSTGGGQFPMSAAGQFAVSHDSSSFL